jgi:hypothetical protein
VKKPEKGSTVIGSTPQQHTKTLKNKTQEKSKVGHVNCPKLGNFASHYSTKHKVQETLSKKPRNSNKWRVCATNPERRDTLLALAQVRQRALALTLTSQTCATHRSDRCRPGQPLLKATRPRRPPLQEPGSEASTDKNLQGMV